MEPGRLGTNGPTRWRTTGRAARRPGLRTRSRAQHGPRMCRRGRLGVRDAAGCRRTGPEVIYPDGARSAHEPDDGGFCTVTVSGHNMCPADIWDGHVDHAVARLTLFRSITFEANMPFALQGIQTVILNGGAARADYPL